MARHEAFDGGEETRQRITFTIDGEKITAFAGQSILEAADAAGIYIPRLCDVEGLDPQGSCRVCTVKVNRRPVASCVHPVSADDVVENDTEEIRRWRRDLIKMLLHEGNHLCPICEASGRCELQAMAARFETLEPDLYPYLQPVRPVDASHPDIMLDTNRCIRCGRCIRASRDVDRKYVFGYIGRGIHKRVGVNAMDLAHTRIDLDDAAASLETCPVGCIIRKRVGFFAPIGRRQFDLQAPGDEIEKRKGEAK